MFVLLSDQISYLVDKIGRMKIARCFGIFVLATTIISVENYELKDIACHDVTEEAICLHSKWFAAPSGRCFDKHGMEYQQNDTIRSCSGCLTFHCVGHFELTTHRTEYFWSAGSESDVDQRCCLSCEGKVFPEGTEMGVSATEVGKCTTEATTSCLYNPATGRGEITEDHSLKDCCLDSGGLHQISSEVLEPTTCSIRECKGTSDQHGHGHSSPYWVKKNNFSDCDCCHLDGSMIPPGGWILSNNKLNLTCCEGKLLVENLMDATTKPTAPTTADPTSTDPKRSSPKPTDPTTTATTTTPKTTTPATFSDQIQGWINGGDLGYMTKEELLLASSLANSGIITKLNYFIAYRISLDGVDPDQLASLIATANFAQLKKVHFSVEQMAALARRSGQAGWRLIRISLWWNVALDTSTARHWATVMSNTPHTSSIQNIFSNISQFYKDLETSLGRAGSKCLSVQFDLRTLQTIQEEEKEIDKLHAALGSWNGRQLRKRLNLIIEMEKEWQK